MSLYVDIDIVTEDTESNIGKVIITRKETDHVEGIHLYHVEYQDAKGLTARSRIHHLETDGAFVLASKAMGEIQRIIQPRIWGQ